MGSLFAVLLLGFALGVRHATDADHVVAVTTIVSRQRSIRGASLIGAAWGVGHTLTIVVVGGAIILFSVAIPPRLGLSMEMAVAAMLVLLGAINLRARGVRAPATPEAEERTAPTSAPLVRPLVVGVVHGLAGSAAVALLVLSTIREPAWAMLYLLLFGGGTVAGMVLLTSIISVPFAYAAERFARINRGLVRVTSVLSIGLGLVLAYQIGVGGGLFSASPHWTPQ